MSTTPLHTSSNGGGGQDGLSPTSMDAQQQQHLLKQHQQHQHPHQQPFTNSLRARNDDHATRGREHTTLTRHPSGTPGPSYPFPSQTESGRPQGMGRFMQGVLKPFRRARLRAQHYTVLDWLQLLLPCVKWLRTYKIKEYLLWDLIAGLSVAFMVVPQSMSYANIAGVPSVYGLYGAFLPVLVYAVFGSSKELAVGPVAVTSLLISSSLKEVVPGSVDITNPNNPPAELVSVQETYNHRAIQLSLLVACMYTAVGVFNLGFLTNFLSHSVIGGFTSGAAIIIGLSQLKYILGYNVPRADKLYEQVHLYLEGIEGFVWQEYVMGMTLLTMLLTVKYFGKRYPKLKWLRPLGPISACVVAIIAVVAGNLQDKGIKIVGHIPAGLPSPTVSWWLPMTDAASLAPLALVVMVVDLLESTSIARALAAKGKYDLSANQEIVGLGLANFAGSAFNAYSTTGSFSRSAVNYDSGSKTGLSGFVTGCVVGLVLLVMTPVFEKLPLNVMGAIVISGVSGLFEYEEAVHLFKVRKLDWCVWMCSFLSTMFLGVEIGLAISIGLALMIVIYESAFPHTALLGRVGRTTIYRNVKQFPDSQVIPGIAACRVDAAMYFANVQYIHERLRKYISRAEAYSEAAGTRLQYVLLDMSPVTHLDTTGATLLEKLHEELQGQGIQLGLCNPACAVVNLLERTGFPDYLGREWVFVRMHDAVQTCLATLISDGQAVRPLSAYDSQVLTPRAIAAATTLGPAPLLFKPPGRHSPFPAPRRSAPAAGDTAALLHKPGRSSFDASRSPLLPHKYDGVHAVGLSPRFSRGTSEGGGGFLSPRIFAAGTGPLGAAVAAGVTPFMSAGQQRYTAGRGASCSGGGGMRSHSSSSSAGRPGSAPGLRSDVEAGLQQHHQCFYGHACDHLVQPLSPSAVHAPYLQQQVVEQQRSSWAANGIACTGAAAAAAPQGQEAGTGLSASLSGSLPGPPPLLRIPSKPRAESADGGLVSACSTAQAVNLGGLSLHLSPAVYNHPAVLSRTQSLAGAGGEGAGGSRSLSSGASFGRPVSPETRKLLLDVFSANDGDAFLEAASNADHSNGAMLQLTALSTEDNVGQAPLIDDLHSHEHMSAAAAAAAQTGEVRLQLPPHSHGDIV